MCSRLRFRSAVIVYIVVLCLALPLWSQSSARLDGTVTDPTQAVVPGAKVVLTNVESGLKYETSTNGAGIFVFPFVPQGTYKMSVSKTGFVQASSTELALHADDRRSMNVSLSVAGGSQSVEVSAAATSVPVVSTGAKSETITSQNIQNLSTMGRNSIELMTLLPGVVTNARTDVGSTPKGSTGYKGVDGLSVNGQREDMNSYKLDGGNMLDLTGNNGNDIYPNMDMISEITVKTNSFTADQGNSPTMIVATTKAGTKQFHGEAYWYGRNPAFNANDWSSNNAGLQRPDSRYNYPGFNIGGPVIIPGTSLNKNRNKLFFFFGSEWSLQRPDNGTVMGNVPTAKMLQGDFSDIVLSPTCLANPTGTYLHQPCNMKDPATGNKTLAEQGGIITGATANGAGLLKELMGPNSAGPNYVDPNGQWNWAANIIRPQNTSLNVLRFDYSPNDKTQIFVRLGRQAQTLYEDYGLYGGPGSTWTSGVAEPTPTVSPYHSRSLSFNIVSVISPTFTNEFGFNTNGLWQPNHYQDPKLLSKQYLGIDFTGVFPDISPTAPQITDSWLKCNNVLCQGGFPGTSRQGVGNLDSANGAFYKQAVFEFSDNLSKVIGKHTLKFGTDIVRGRNDQNAGDFTEGLLTTGDGWGSAFSTGAEFGDIVTERFVTFAQNSDRNLVGRFRFSNFEWYAQDSWKVTPRLTLEYGARWSFLPPWTEASGVAAAFDPTIYDPTRVLYDPYDGMRIAASNPVCGNGPFPVCGSIPNGVLQSGHPLTQPRLGFAWDTFGSGKFVLRGGFGQYTQRDQGNSIYKGMIAAAPYNVLSQFSNWDTGMTLANIEALSSSAIAQTGNNIWSRDIKDNHMPAIYEYNLTVSTQLPKQLQLEVSYVGTQSRHLLEAKDMNSVAPGSMWVPGTHISAQAPWTTDLTFRPYPSFGQIDYIDHSGNANYNALQTTIRRQAGHGLDLVASYTYGKAMGYTSYFEDLMDPFDRSHMYRPLELDRTHLLSFAYMYHVPKLARGFMADSKFARGALNGWMVSGITRFTSGGPYTIQTRVNCVLDPAALTSNPNTPNPCADQVTNPAGLNWQPTSSWFGTTAFGETFNMGSSVVHPTFTCNPVSSSHNGLNTPWINTDCVTLPAFGDGGAWVEPYMKGPGSQNFDLAIMKSYMMGEKRKLQFRLSMFNMLNHAQLNTPNNIAYFNWVMPAGATDLSQGKSQLLNNSGGCAGNNDAYAPQLGLICGKTGHREMELAVRFYF